MAANLTGINTCLRLAFAEQVQLTYVLDERGESPSKEVVSGYIERLYGYIEQICSEIESGAELTREHKASLRILSERVLAVYNSAERLQGRGRSRSAVGSILSRFNRSGGLTQKLDAVIEKINGVASEISSPEAFAHVAHVTPPALGFCAGGGAGSAGRRPPPVPPLPSRKKAPEPPRGKKQAPPPPATQASGAGGQRKQLLAQIQGGVPLRLARREQEDEGGPANPGATAAAAGPTDPCAQLMEQIRGGKANLRRAVAPARNGARKKPRLKTIYRNLEAIMEARRAVMSDSFDLPTPGSDAGSEGSWGSEKV